MRLASRPLLRRLIAIDRLIRGGKHPNCRRFEQELQIHRRTVLRDLDFLKNSLGAPLEFCRRRQGYHYSNPDWTLPAIRLTEGELIALYLSERLLEQHGDTPFASDIASAFGKLASALSNEVTADLSRLAAFYSVRLDGRAKAAARCYRQLTDSIKKGTQLEIEYWSASRDETRRRIIDPYHLALIDGRFYLAAYCHLREEVRLFVPSRILRLKATGKVFERPVDFRIDSYLDGSFRAMRGAGQPAAVRLWFSPEAARFVEERTWHPSQVIECREADGSLVLSLRVTHLLGVRRWVLSWGSACRVLEPDSLRREIEGEARAILRASRARKREA